MYKILAAATVVAPRIAAGLFMSNPKPVSGVPGDASNTLPSVPTVFPGGKGLFVDSPATNPTERCAAYPPASVHWILYV